MYADPKKVKDIRLSTRLNDYQQHKLVYVADALSEHPSALFRKLAMLHIDAVYDRILLEEDSCLERMVRSSACAVEALLKPVQPPCHSSIRPPMHEIMRAQRT